MNKGKNFLQKEFTGLGLVVIGIIIAGVILTAVLIYIFIK